MQIGDRKRAQFAQRFRALLRSYGASDDGLEQAIEAAVAQLIAALCETADDGSSLSPLDVVRIRANKFAALRLPPALFRESATLAALRGKILVLARALLAEDN